MKIINYTPLIDLPAIQEASEIIPVEVLSEVIFQNTSLEDALEELRREGYKDSSGRKVLPGIRDLLEQIKAIREALPAEGDGPVKSGGSSQKDVRNGSACIQPASSEEKPLATLEHLQKIQVLEKLIKRVYWGFDPESIDDKLLEDLLGKQSLKEWQVIKNLNNLVLELDLAKSGPSGLTLTSRGLQRIAWNILKEIYKLRKTEPRKRRLDSPLSTELHLTEGTRPYRFGDPPLIEPSQSLLNAIKRTGKSFPIKLREEDLEVYQKESLSRSATVILLDLSRSMRFENRYIAAKKVTLALHGLMGKRYPHDRFAVVGFSTKAFTVKNNEIPFLTWDEMNPYTNMEEAIDLSQKILSRQKGYRKQVFIITDGEPTAHREKGYLFFQFPPHPKTLAKTLKRIQGLARQNIEISIFLLSREKERVQFVHQMAQSCRGRIFHIEQEDLGWCLLMDYVDKKSKWMGSNLHN
jgi:uncharacterized protein with von Willebrand factor type A (vWA) domain